jgi:hypothetical protein
MEGNGYSGIGYIPLQNNMAADLSCKIKSISTDIFVNIRLMDTDTITDNFKI